MSQTPMVPGTKYQDAKRPGHGLSLPPIVLAAICLGRQISRRQMSQRLMSRSQKSWPGNVPGAKSPNANCPKRQMSAGKCLSADGEPPFVSLPQNIDLRILALSFFESAHKTSLPYVACKYVLFSLLTLTPAWARRVGRLVSTRITYRYPCTAY